MTERIKENKSFSLYVTPEMVEEGVASYRTMFSSGKHEHLAIILNHKLDFQTLFLGIQPWYSYINSDFSPEDAHEFVDTIRKNHPGILTVTNLLKVDSETDETITGFAFIHKKAAQIVMENNPRFFSPEARTNIEEYITHLLNEWYSLKHKNNYINHIRLGLLSRFPISSCIRYVQHTVAENKLVLEMLSNEEITQYENLFYNNSVDIDENLPQARKLIEKAGQRLTTYERRLFLHSRPVMYFNEPWYWGFDIPRDREFLNQMEQIYLDSGINKISRSFEEEIYPPGE